jgi:hypothetical protein
MIALVVMFAVKGTLGICFLMTVVLLLQFNYTLERYIVHRLVASALHAAVVALVS